MDLSQACGLLPQRRRNAPGATVGDRQGRVRASDRLKWARLAPIDVADDRQRHINPVIRPSHANQAGDRRKATLSQKLLTIVANRRLVCIRKKRKSDVFEEWIDNLRDRAGAAQVLRRIARLERGNPGRVAPVGEGVSEPKIDFGPGYRVYFGRRGEELVIILGGGDKSSQDRDIKAAKKLWDEWKEKDR